MKVMIYFNTTCDLNKKEISNVKDICIYEDYIEISYSAPPEWEQGIMNSMEIPRSIIDCYEVSGLSKEGI